MTVAGIDFSSKAVDIVLLDEDTDAATWHRFALTGQDAFDRARDVRRAMHDALPLWDDVLASGIEDPRGYGAGSLYRIQGAILSRLPPLMLVHPWIPSQWRKAVGLPGNASKADVRTAVTVLFDHSLDRYMWPQDACDAYCIALATRQIITLLSAA